MLIIFWGKGCGALSLDEWRDMFWRGGAISFITGGRAPTIVYKLDYAHSAMPYHIMMYFMILFVNVLYTTDVVYVSI